MGDFVVGRMAAFRAHRVAAVLFRVDGFALFEEEVYLESEHGAFYLASECTPMPYAPVPTARIKRARS